MKNFDASLIDWSKTDGLVPAIVQDARSLRVLMLGYMNAEALQRTRDDGVVTFFSRSKQRLWMKGETSGHVLRLVDIHLDCDQDALLILANPEGPTCHTGTLTCWGEAEDPSLATLADLAAVIRQRHQHPDSGSYTAKLLAEGLPRMAQKVGEEGVETALAAVTAPTQLAAEAADLLYHLLVLLEGSGIDWLEVMQVLHQRGRMKKSG